MHTYSVQIDINYIGKPSEPTAGYLRVLRLDVVWMDVMGRPA